ncbi:unnamed protein product [Hyaloperonospora brassicae]|uniref:PHD-type domain-containing protein n=1 Tax=Hyaloperonospora brassicae TaxID=162125 RepID=A0AAV0TYZ2_HYABA|nr:unnamed protein product [Hyaloperonospora brassicae]
MLLRGRHAELHKSPTCMRTVQCASPVVMRRPLAGHGTIPTLTDGGEKTAQRPVSSPRPSPASSDDNSRSDHSFTPSGKKSDSDDESPPPPAKNSRDGGDDQKEERDDGRDERRCDSTSSSSSSSESSVDESDVENEDGWASRDVDGDDKDNGIDPTDDDLSGESDGSSDLENSYPRLPPAPVDVLITLRQQAAHKEFQLTEKVKQQVVADARRRYHERQQAHRSKKRTSTLHSTQRHSHRDEATSGPKHREKRRRSVSTDVPMARQRQEEDEWLVDCSCGLKKKNYDDGTSMIQCDICQNWVHAKCADKLPEAVAQEKFVCFRCCWMFDCVCAVRRRPNHDDGQRMVECESCNTWQHTMCVGIPMAMEPAHDYQCPRCVKKARRRKSGSKRSSRRDRHRKRNRGESPRRSRKRADSSHAASVHARSSARSLNNLESKPRSHRSRRAEVLALNKKERKASTGLMPSPPSAPAASPSSTPPPPPSSPPPSRSARHDSSNARTEQRSRNEKKRSSASTSSLRRKRSHSLGSSLTKAHTEASETECHSLPSDAVAPSPRGKGLMLRGYSPAAATMSASSLRSENVRPPLPLTPSSTDASSENRHNNHGHIGRKRKVSSARDRLEKKLKIRKSSMR